MSRTHLSAIVAHAAGAGRNDSVTSCRRPAREGAAAGRVRVGTHRRGRRLVDIIPAGVVNVLMSSDHMVGEAGEIPLYVRLLAHS